MDASSHIVPEFNVMGVTAAVVIAFIFISIMSFIKEPNRQKINALIIAGAGGVYLTGGMGVWEFVFGALMLFIAFKGLRSYYFIGIGWILHTGWDIVHHLYGQPIVPFAPSSSAGCAVCDPILALWFFLGAPSIWKLIIIKRKISI